MGDIVKRCESARRLLSLGYDWEKNLARLTQEPATEACLSNYFGWLVPRGELGKTPVCSLASTQNRGQKTDVFFYDEAVLSIFAHTTQRRAEDTYVFTPNLTGKRC